MERGHSISMTAEALASAGARVDAEQVQIGDVLYKKSDVDAAVSIVRFAENLSTIPAEPHPEFTESVLKVLKNLDTFRTTVRDTLYSLK